MTEKRTAVFSDDRVYRYCKECGQPMLRKGQKRKHPDDYRHAQGCPLDKLDARGSMFTGHRRDE